MDTTDHELIRGMVEEIDEEVDHDELTDWEVQFITDILEDDIRHFSKSQADSVLRIHEEHCI